MTLIIALILNGIWKHQGGEGFNEGFIFLVWVLHVMFTGRKKF